MLNIVKNTLNFKNFSLKPILMSSIIFVNAVVYVLMVTSTVAYASLEDRYLCTKEELLEIADNHVNNLLCILGDNHATFLKDVEEKLAKQGMTKDHPNYTKALEIPGIKKQIDLEKSKYIVSVNVTKKYGEEVHENIQNGTPFSCEANKEFWENYLRDLDESGKIWNDYLSVYSDSDSQAPSCVSLNGCEEEQEEKIAESQTENSYSYCNIC